jgi:hypothetical protein
MSRVKTLTELPQEIENHALRPAVSSMQEAGISRSSPSAMTNVMSGLSLF